MRLPFLQGILPIKQGILLVLSDVIDPVKAELDRYELADLIGKDAFFESINALVSAYDKRPVDVKDE